MKKDDIKVLQEVQKNTDMAIKATTGQLTD